jgi:hypothetical protein
MNDVATFRLERDIRESAAFLTDREADNAEVRLRLMRALAEVRDSIGRQDAVRLETLIERLTGGRNGR